MRDTVILALLVVLVAVCNSTGAEPIVVRSEESVQEAIDRAAAGTVIVLSAGVYRESLVVDKSLTLRGSDSLGVAIVGLEQGSVIRILGDDTVVRLESLTVRGGVGFAGHGIEAEDSASVTLSQVRTCDNSWCGVWAKDKSHVLLQDSESSSNGTFGLYGQDFATLTLERSRVTDNNTHGLFILHYAEVLVRDSTVSENWSGLWMWDGSRVAVENSAVCDNIDVGISVWNAGLLRLRGATVAGNGSTGIWLAESSRGILNDSSIAENGSDGILLQEDAVAEISDCIVIANGEAGIRAWTPSCAETFNPDRTFKGTVTGEGNYIPGPDETEGNAKAGLCPPHPGALWPPDFLTTDSPEG